MEEHYGSSSLHRYYSRSGSGRYVIRYVNKDRFVSVSHFFKTVFLPQGYPESVSKDYLTYQIWDTVQAFASSITGTLAAQAVLKGVGVGDESATVLAATFTWLLKDGTGMLGRILFAWLQGTHLDCDAKRWRLFADIINDLAIFLEIMGPNFPGIFTLILCISGVLKSIVGVAGGATRAALTLHQARRNNMADVSAKDGSQETLVNLVALICNLLLVPIVTGRHMLIWSLYIIFTSLHLYANYSAVKGVIMETLNQARLHILLQEYFRTGTISYTSVIDVNKLEPVLWTKLNHLAKLLNGTQRKFTIHLGASLHNLYNSLYDVDQLFTVFQNSRYILWVNRKKDEIHIALRNTSDYLDQLQACYHAELINFAAENINNTQITNPGIQTVLSSYRSGDIDLIHTSYSHIEKTFTQFIEDLNRNKWKTNVSLLCADEWRIVR